MKLDDLPSAEHAPIVLSGLTRRFGERVVLDGLNLSIPAGQFLAVVGRSGCGKSTLLRLLAGLDRADGGELRQPAQQSVRVMFQEARLLPWKSVLDNVALGLAPAQREQARDALAEVGLADRADEWPARLSGGQRQRVALARALVHQPRLLLLDEPLGALDALTRLDMQGLIERLWLAHRCTTVLVTHDVGEAVNLADRVVLVENGQVAMDTPVPLARSRNPSSQPACRTARSLCVSCQPLRSAWRSPAASCHRTTEPARKRCVSSQPVRTPERRTEAACQWLRTRARWRTDSCQWVLAPAASGRASCQRAMAPLRWGRACSQADTTPPAKRRPCCQQVCSAARVTLLTLASHCRATSPSSPGSSASIERLTPTSATNSPRPGRSVSMLRSASGMTTAPWPPKTRRPLPSAAGPKTSFPEATGYPSNAPVSSTAPPAYNMVPLVPRSLNGPAPASSVTRPQKIGVPAPSHQAAPARYSESGIRREGTMSEVSTFLIRENNEELTWFFTQDITDVIKKQDELRELNLLLDGILNNIPVYLFVKDPENDFRYLYWNKAFADHSGIPASKAIGHTDYEVFPSHGDAEKFRKDDLELLQTHKRIDMQETYLSANGEARIVQTLKALVPMEGRKPLLIGISWDITNLQNIEQELIKARIKAEQSDRLKSAFLANMSHEIRTPLNAIVGFSQLLPSAETAEEKKLYSGIINQNSDILLQLINDILDLSKIEAGTLEYIKRPMNLGEVCRTIYAVHKERVKEGVTLVFDNEEEDLLMEGDQNRIMQVITNFLTNASKFTYEGEIRFGFGRMDKDIRVYVKDTGIGIEPEKVDHIFERFVKLNSFAQGTGLGLSICRMIIEKIGGEIGVTSELGKGSTFYFTIPYEETGEHGKFFKESKVVSKGNTVNRVQQIKKILVAEDVESNFILLKNLIGREYTLLWAKDGVEAIEMYKQYQPDLILMDVKMPRMDGLEATHIIRSYSKEIPIIALTAYAFEADKELALEMGCNDFVTKPISERTLRKALDKYSTTV